MKVKTTLNAASLPAAVDEAVKRGYDREHAERILSRYVESRFPILEETPNDAFMTHADPGDEHEALTAEMTVEERQEMLELWYQTYGRPEHEQWENEGGQ